MNQFSQDRYYMDLNHESYFITLKQQLFKMKYQYVRYVYLVGEKETYPIIKDKLLGFMQISKPPQAVVTN